MCNQALLCQFPHHFDQVGLAFEPDPRNVGHDDVAILHSNAVREAAVWLEEIRIAFIAA
jgi:hypothetical protein